MNNGLKVAIGLVWIQLWLSTALPAQDLNQGFYPIDREQLSGSSVSCALKDSRGFMWFGTYEGLSRFDGTTVKVYKHVRNDPSSLCHSDINAIIEDQRQNLWIGTANGLVTYDRAMDNFINVDLIDHNINHLTNGYITALAADDTGHIWIGTIGGGLNVYDTKSHRFTYTLSGNDKDHYEASSYITSIAVQDGLAYVGTRGGLRIFNTSTLEPVSVLMDNGLGTSEITCLINGRDSRLLAGLPNGTIIEFQYHDDTFSSAIMADVKDITRSAPYIRALCMDSQANLWIVSEKSGLIRLDADTKEIRQFLPEAGNSYSLPTSCLRSIYSDNHDRLWLGTYSAGVYFMDNQIKKFELYQRNPFNEASLTGNNVRTFAQDREGNVWIGGDGGLSLFNLKTQQFYKPPHINQQLQNTLVKDILIDNRENIWIGTRDEGVIKTDAAGKKQQKYNVISGGVGDNKIVSLYQDKRKTIWAGTLGSGLFYFDETLNRFVHLHESKKPDYIPNTYVTDILESSDSTLWVATLNGLHALTRETNHTFSYKAYFQTSQPGGLSSSRVTVIYEDPTRTLWFGTFDNGVNRFIRESNSFDEYTELDGMPSNSIKGIMADDKGNLWISSTAGISRLNPADKTLTHYTKADGLNSNNFNSNSCLKLASGKFLFGGDNGFNAFYPDSINEKSVAPVMYLTDLKINNSPVKIGGKGSPLQRHIGVTQALSLSYEQRSFSIDFVALSYGVASKNQYSYRLEGFEESWNVAGGNRTATYTNIDPGEYVFVVKGTNSDGVWSDVPARLSITIHPPLWKTCWAMVLYVLAFAFLIYLFLRIRTSQIRIKNQLKLEKIAREKEHELTVSKMNFFTNISHELRTPLSLILMPLEKVVLSSEIPMTLKKSLSTAYKNASNLTKLVNELMDFSKFDEVKPTLTVQQGEIVRYITEIASNFNEVAERKDIRLAIHSSAPQIIGWFDVDKLDKVVRNLLSNAFKFTTCKGEIKILIDAHEDVRDSSRHVAIRVVDNGIGIAPEELPLIFNKFYQAKTNSVIPHTGTGIGLSLVQTLLEVHHGNISVESTPNKGTSFIVTFPIDRTAYLDQEIAEAPFEVIEQNEETIDYENIVIDHSLGKPELLVVEDNDELRSYLVSEFSSEFSVTEAVDGNEGFNIASKTIPDVIISDVMLPLKSGTQLCKEIKSDLRTSHIPVVLLTARSSVKDQVVGLESGADVYIAKPFSLIVLKTQVRQMILARKKLYARYSQEAYLMPASLADNQLDREFLQKALDYIEQNLLNPQLSVEAIAELFNVSRSQVYRKIKALTGHTVVEFIRTIRLKHALKLMEEKRYTLSEIAFQTGFNSLSYFTRSFKDQYGSAPSEYLAHAKNQ